MRVDRKTGQSYENFGHWLLTDRHIIWIISLFLAYAYYLGTTEEV
jgi:hypothetical protein